MRVPKSVWGGIGALIIVGLLFGILKGPTGSQLAQHPSAGPPTRGYPGMPRR